MPLMGWTSGIHLTRCNLPLEPNVVAGKDAYWIEPGFNRLLCVYCWHLWNMSTTAVNSEWGMQSLQGLVASCCFDWACWSLLSMIIWIARCGSCLKRRSLSIIVLIITVLCNFLAHQGLLFNVSWPVLNLKFLSCAQFVQIFTSDVAI